MNLSPQAIKILEVLEDGGKHCPIEWGYADGHGKRFTDINRYLNQFSKKLENDWCDCGRHTTKIKMRWIEDFEVKRYQSSTPPSQLTNFKGNFAKNAYPSFRPATTQAPLFEYSGVYEH